MITINVNDRKHEIPTCWEEMTTGMFERIKSVNDPDLLKVFGALIEMDFQDVANINSEETEIALYQCCAFIVNQDEYFRKWPIQKNFIFNGKKIEIPKNIESLTIEQNIHLKNELTDSPIESKISFAIAVYLQPKIDQSKFNLDRVKEIQKEIQQMPIEQTFPIGFFLGKRVWIYGKSISMRLTFNKLIRWMRHLLKRPE